MKSCLIVFYHEISKLVHDKKMLASMFFIPMFAAIFLGIITSMDSTEEATKTTSGLYALNNCIEELSIEYSESQSIEVIPSSCLSYEELINCTELSQDDAALQIEDNNVIIYYNSSSDTSSNVASICQSLLLSQYYNTTLEQMHYSPQEIEINDLSQKKSNAMLALFLPYMLVLLLFTNVSNYTCDTIAGEKERGTFSKLLLTPTTASSIIMGKTISSMFCGFVSTACYFIILYIGSLVSKKLFDIELLGFEISGLNGTEVSLIIVYVVLLSFLLASLAVLCSLFAKTSKEARSMLVPFMGVSIFASILSILRIGEVPVTRYLIPMYNLCITLQDILNSSIDLTKMAATAISLLACVTILFLITIISMKNERIRY